MDILFVEKLTVTKGKKDRTKDKTQKYYQVAVND
jgi:hypothetical protein